MKKYSLTTLLLLFLTAIYAFAAESNWATSGTIPGTELAFTDLSVTKQGLSVRVTNNSLDPVKVSLRISFFDNQGNNIGHSVIALREVPAEAFFDVTNNYINGNWKACRDSHRMEFRHMTYEVLYY